ADLLLQLRVFFLNLLERKVVLPRGADARRDRIRNALHFRKDAEHRLLEHGYAAFGGHLRGYQDDVTNDHRKEEVTGTAADIDDSHCLRRSILHRHGPQRLGDTETK